jgi:Uma2 family endonuclease
MMNVQLPMHMGKDAFLAWAEGREERYELVDGHVVMMTRPRRAHAIIVGNLIVALRRRLDPRKWTVIAEFGLDAGPRTLRFPDIVVDQVGGEMDDRWASGPVLLAEVLSGSSRKTDLEDKPVEFLRIPSLQAYLVFAQREAKAWVWLREAASFASQARELVGLDQVIHITALETELPLIEVYAGLTFGHEQR